MHRIPGTQFCQLLLLLFQSFLLVFFRFLFVHVVSSRLAHTHLIGYGRKMNCAMSNLGLSWLWFETHWQTLVGSQ